MKIALIHDWLVTMRGGEKVLEALCRTYPDADVYTIYYCKDKVSLPIRNLKVHTSFIQKLPFAGKNFRMYLGLFPLAVESFDLTGYDLIISTSHCVAKGVIPGPKARHICYCHSPMRYVWDFSDEYFGGLKANWVIGPVIRALLAYLKNWDVKSCNRVDEFIANSKNIAGKIKKYYNRTAFVIYPPVDTDFFNVDIDNKKIGDYFLLVSSLVPYKRVDIAVDAFNRAGYRLKIVGQGPLANDLKSRAGSNIEFIGWSDDASLRSLYQNCRGFIFNQEEDFGISAVEAQACGKPVIAYARGGALETVIAGETGVFFKEQTVESLIEALEKFNKLKFDSRRIRENALKFNNMDQFNDNMNRFIQGAQ
jgi:glycosyltransferase involved in cell wall biosynthesis